MTEAQAKMSPQGSLLSLRSYRYHPSVGSISRTLRPSTSFATVNHKRSFRPAPFIMHSLVEFFPGRVPLAFATANPAVRVFTETSVSRSDACHASGEAGIGVGASTQRRGFALDGFSITKEPMEPFIAPCDEGGVVEDDSPVRPSGNPTGPCGCAESRGEDPTASPGSFSASASTVSAGGTISQAPENPGYTQAYPFYFAEPYLSSQTSTAGQHYYPFVGYESGSGFRSRQRITLAGASLLHDGRVFDGVAAGGAWNSHRLASGSLNSPPPQSSTGVGVSSREALAAEVHLSNSRCWHGSVSELSLCASLSCSSTKGLNMVLFSAWWLSRYYGISLTLEGFRQTDLLGVFKEVVRLLSIKQLTFVRCVLSQEWMQSISSCVDLLSLTLAGCEAEGDVSLMYVDSILTKQVRLSGHRLANQSKWYIAGNLFLGLLRHLKCLHIIHTPVKQEFLEVVAASATNLECLILHKTRGITSLQPLTKLGNLRCLSIQSSSIDDHGVEAIGDCGKLQRLYLVECRRVLSLDFLKSSIAKSLRQLTLSYNWFSEDHMHAVAACTRLMELQLLSLKRLTSIAPLASLEDLEVLNLADTCVTVEGTENALKAMRLTRVNLASCTAVSSIRECLRFQSTTITSLDLSATGVDDDGLDGVASCALLRYLNLMECPKLSSIASLRGIPGLRWLELGGTNVTDEDLVTQLRGPLAKTLRVLSLRDCKNVRHLSFLKSFAATGENHQRRGSSLYYLDLENVNISDAEVVHLKSCRSLKFLNMSRCGRLTDVRPLSALRRLRQLQLSYTGVNSAGLSSLAGCVALEVLDLRHCRELSCLAALASLPVLRELRLDGFEQTKTEAYLQCPQPPRRRRVQSHSNREYASSLLAASESGSASTPYANLRTQSARSLGSGTPTSSVGSVLPSPRFSNSSVSSGRAGGPNAEVDEDSGDVSFTAENSPHSNESVALLNLERFSARKSALNEAGLHSLLAASQYLVYLDIAECFCVANLRGLEHLRSLRDLVASQCPRLGNAAIRTISQLPSLRRLSLFGCTGFTDLSPLGRLNQLEELDASLTKVTDEGLAQLGNCVALTHLYLADCRFLTSVRPLGTLAFLRVLHLESTGVTDAGVSALASCGCLQRLYLTKCKKITDVTELAARLKQLETLDVYGTSIPTRKAGEPRSSACALM